MIDFKLFYCRATFFNRVIQDLTVFVWELEPLDGRMRSAREWIEEHIRDNYPDLFPTLGIEGDGGWEAVFVATIRTHIYGPPGQEYDESIELRNWMVQPLPPEMFE